MRVGQKNELTYRWARKGSRPRAIHDQRTQSTYVFGAVCPERGTGAESWLQKSEQGDKRSFCLTAGKIDPRIRRDNEQTSPPEPHTGWSLPPSRARRRRHSPNWCAV
jgi:hypothetical protein